MSSFFEGWVHSDAARKDSIDLKRVYIDICGGNLHDAVIFSQIMFWHEPNKRGESRLAVLKNGHYWLAKRYEDWYEECRIDTDTARKCIDRLVKSKLLIKKVYHFKGKPTVHIRVDKDEFQRRILALSDTTGQIEPKRPDVSDGNDTTGQMEMIPQVISYTETTTEITPESTTTTTVVDEPDVKSEPPKPVADPEAVGKVVRAYESHIGMITPHIKELLVAAVQDYPLDWILEAINIAVENNVLKWRYAGAILESWRTKGKTGGKKILSIEDAPSNEALAEQARLRELKAKAAAEEQARLREKAQERSA